MASFQAVVFDAERQQLIPRELDSIKLLENEVLVSIQCCTICGSDLHTFSGRRSGPNHAILGHEIIGRVESWLGKQPVDHQGRLLHVGDRITWTLCASCGRCANCVRGLPQKCEQLFKYGHEAFAGDRPSGGLATHCVLRPGTTIFAVPDELPDSVACPANCATATVMASIRLLQEVTPVQGRIVLIAGMGMLGLTAAAVCSRLEASRVVAVDVSQTRLELARQFGATHTILAGSEFESQLLQATDREQADAALEFSGNRHSVSVCLDSLRTGGTLIVAGSVFPSDPIALHPEQLVRRLLTLRGIHNYRPDDLARAIQFLLENHQRFPFSQLVEREYRLEDSDAAFRFACEAAPVRLAVKP